MAPFEATVAANHRFIHFTDWYVADSIESNESERTIKMTIKRNRGKPLMFFKIIIMVICRVTQRMTSRNERNAQLLSWTSRSFHEVDFVKIINCIIINSFLLNDERHASDNHIIYYRDNGFYVLNALLVMLYYFIFLSFCFYTTLKY